MNYTHIKDTLECGIDLLDDVLDDDFLLFASWSQTQVIFGNCSRVLNFFNEYFILYSREWPSMIPDPEQMASHADE